MANFKEKSKHLRQSSNVFDYRKGQPLGSTAASIIRGGADFYNPRGSSWGPGLFGRKGPSDNKMGARFIQGMSNPVQNPLGLRLKRR